MGFDTDYSDSNGAPRCNPPSTSPRTSLDFTTASQGGGSSDWTKNDDIFSLGDYLICTRHLLGRGSFGEVKLGFHRSTGRRVAVKIINKTQLSPEKRQEVDREIEILKKVGSHPCIVSLHDVAEDERFIYMFFEYVASDLLRFLKQHGRLDEPTVFRIFSQLVEAVSYLHANGIVHRDIKIENILIDDATLSVKLCDFGFATYYTPSTRFEKWCGSPHTVAPEIIQRIPYSGPKVDVWSLGSVLYTMICAFFPFQATVPKDVLKRTVLGKFHAFPGGCGSRATRDLISRCLTIDSDKRITLDHVRQHPFFWKHEKTVDTGCGSVEENESGEEGTTTEWSDSMDVMTC